MAHHVPAQNRVRHALLRHEAAHHLTGMGEGRQTDDSPHVVVARGMQQRSGGAHGMAQKRQAVCSDLGLQSQPGQAGGNVFGKPRPGRESLVVAAAVAARVDQQNREAGSVQWQHHRPHRAGVRTPAVHRQHGRCAALLRWRLPPGSPARPARHRAACHRNEIAHRILATERLEGMPINSSSSPTSRRWSRPLETARSQRTSASAACPCPAL